MEQELSLCLAGFLLGVKLKVAYDVLALLRCVWPAGIIRISIEDLLFFFITGILIFNCMYIGNDGVFRGFIIGFVILGALVYSTLLGKFLYKKLELAIKKLKKYADKILKIIIKKVNIKKSQS